MTEGLLTKLRVLDLGGADADGVSRLFADLGADVLKVEPPGGSPARHDRPAVSGAGIPFALHNANKRCTVLDPVDAADRIRFLDLAETADIVVDSGNPGRAAAFGTSCAELANRFGHLVALSVTDFGVTGPYASWRATDPVFYAMSTALSRSGPTVGKPVLPPVGIASATAAVQAAWAALVAYYHRLRCGRGDYIDFSRFEAVVQSLDPPFGSEGQAAAGQKRLPNCGVAAPAISTSTRYSPAATAMSDSACCHRASGGGCGHGWANRSSSKTPSSTLSPPDTPHRVKSTTSSVSYSRGRPWPT